MKKIIALLSFIMVINTGCSQNTNSKNIADEFLNSLSSSQKEKALIEFEDDTRTKWHYFPATSYSREGIPLKELNLKQKKLVHQLLQTYLSKSGYKKATTAIEVEGILRDLTNSPVRRDPELYYVTFYGSPSIEKIWGWSFEGHHLSLNFTIDNNHVSYVPIFYGANPAIVKSGPKKGFRSLVNEEDMALKLINMLDTEQQQKAIFSNATFSDIRTGNASKISPLKNEGITASEMNTSQQKVLFELINEYASSAPKNVAEIRLNTIKSEEIENIYFAWAGKTELGKSHYYRIQGKTFLIEFDNSQNDANHIHAVWRDFDGDFGRDLIKEHYQNAHH